MNPDNQISRLLSGIWPGPADRMYSAGRSPPVSDQAIRDGLDRPHAPITDEGAHPVRTIAIINQKGGCGKTTV
ncbi:MAG: hypothetical protein AAGB26_15725, partial [Planctomycetota bacterium]